MVKMVCKFFCHNKKPFLVETVSGSGWEPGVPGTPPRPSRACPPDPGSLDVGKAQ